MGKYRNKLQIVADILSITETGAKKTQIMYKANLSYQLLIRYLTDVVEAGLVALGSMDYYMLTRKGREFLNRYKKYAKRRRRLEEYSNDISNERMILKEMCFKAETADDGSNTVSVSNQNPREKRHEG